MTAWPNDMICFRLFADLNLIIIDSMENIEKIESDLWEAADQLRANSKLTSTEYCIPVLGIIFLRHAANRFDAATRQIKEDQEAGRMPKRPPVKADFIKRRALYPFRTDGELDRKRANPG